MSEFEELDFSLKSYDEWISFLFDRPLRKPLNEDAFEGEEITSSPERPLVLVEYLTRLCRELPDLVTIYDWPQIDQALWGALAYPFDIARDYLWDSHWFSDSPIPLEPRIECVRAMESVYPDVVAKIPDEVPRENIFQMWWHIVCSGYRSGEREKSQCSPVETDEMFQRLGKILDLGIMDIHSPEDLVKFKNRFGEQFETANIKSHCCRVPIEELACPNGPVLQAVFESLQNILALEDMCCQDYALHGLGHCPHPGSAAVVQDFIDRHREEIAEREPEVMVYLEECRDGTVM